MGGTALAFMGEYSQRISHELYYVILEDVSKQLTKYNIKHSSIPFVREKVDFGDIDIVVESSNNIREFIDGYVKGDNHFSYHKNGGVYSFHYAHKYQIDLIMIPPKYFDYAVSYLGQNDFGNFIGRVLKPYGYKQSILGLYYVNRYGSSYKKDLLLSLDYRDVFDILKIDYQTYLDGFDTFDQMFEFISNSPSFDKSKFQFHNLTNADRIRDVKRSTYNNFLDFLEQKTFDNILPPVSPFEKYPHLQLEVDKLNEQMATITRFKDKFNGNVVSNLTGLKGKELGNMMVKLKSVYTQEQLSNGDIESMVLEVFNER